MEHLFERLKQYAAGDTYPYHMPGHKRRPWGALPGQLYEMDITEIEGFDNLHQPEGILLELQRRAAGLYGADESFYLVNGSTCGVLCAVSCTLPSGGHILMSRNCHKSAYHGAYLRNLTVSYLWPPYLEEYDIYDAVTPGQVQEALEQEPDIGAVLIVSPTYEGRIADVRAIAEVVHRKGIPLIVDEAHGAHLGLGKDFPPNSCQAGADLVVHSVHKTLPSLTQTALLHVKWDRIDRAMVRRFLHIYQTSSPSYLLMASIDNALQYAELEGEEAFGRFASRYGEMLERLENCRYLKFLRDEQEEEETSEGKEALERKAAPEERARQDIGKLLISVKGMQLTGHRLYEILLEKYQLQTEMAAESYVLAMFTVNDGEEAYSRMTDALLEIDKNLSEEQGKEQKKERERGQGKKQGEEKEKEYTREKEQEKEQEKGQEKEQEKGQEKEQEKGQEKEQEKGQEKEQEKEQNKKQTESIPLARAWDMPWEEIPLEESVGRYVGEFISLYPPGTPLLVPGERMTTELCRRIRSAWEQGLTVQGIRVQEGGLCAGGNPENNADSGSSHGTAEIYVNAMRMVVDRGKGRQHSADLLTD